MIWYEIARGFDDSLYGPFIPVAREQMSSFVARHVEVSGGSFPATRQDAFTDDQGSVHDANINKLSSQAYEYRSGRTITPRGDYFTDDAGNTHEANINKSAEVGFTGGRNRGYEPREPVNRDAMASFLARALDLLVEQGLTRPKS